MFRHFSARLAGVVCCLAMLAFPIMSQQAPSAQFERMLAQFAQYPAGDTRRGGGRAPFAADERVISAMVDACTDVDPAVRKYAAINLGHAEDARGVAPLCALLKDGNANIRSAAITALLRIDDVSALPALLAVLQHADPSDDDSPLRTLDTENVRQALLALARDPEQHLSRRGHRSARFFTRGAPHGNRSCPICKRQKAICWTAEAMAAGRIGDPRVVAPLLKLLANPPRWSNRNMIIRALGNLGDARAVDPLGAALRSSDTPNALRGEIANALGKIGDPRAIPGIDRLVAGGERQSAGFPTHDGRVCPWSHP